MPGYNKFMKNLMTNKRSINFETIKVTHQVSAIVHSMAPKLEDPDAFAIPYTIRSVDFAKSLCDLGARINLMTYLVFKTLGIRKARPTLMRLQMVDHCEVDYEVPIILGRYFLATGKAHCDVEVKELTFWVGDEQMRQPNNNE
uniref:Uncharacterized protein n=1 Tax=Nicotiana tabacum TaxID=4097 RepID=A0A1S4BZK9_TOBAC